MPHAPRLERMAGRRAAIRCWSRRPSPPRRRRPLVLWPLGGRCGGIDRTSKFAFAQLHERATTRIAADFLRALLQAAPCRVHTALTGNGQHFTTPGNTASAAPLIREAMDRGEIFRAHSFELACAQSRIEHRLTKPYHPWMNGPVERMNSQQVRRDRASGELFSDVSAPAWSAGLPRKPPGNLPHSVGSA